MSELSVNNEEIAKGVASLDARGVEQDAILNSLGLSLDELSLVRRSSAYQEALKGSSGKVIADDLSVDAKWDEVENLTLDALIGDLRTGSMPMEPMSMMQMAAKANIAKRKYGKGSSSDNGNSAGTINVQNNNVQVLQLPRVMLDRLNGVASGETKVVNEQQLADTYGDFTDLSLSKEDVHRVLKVDVQKTVIDTPVDIMDKFGTQFDEQMEGSGLIATEAG